MDIVTRGSGVLVTIFFSFGMEWRGGGEKGARVGGSSHSLEAKPRQRNTPKHSADTAPCRALITS